jgi:putative DNA primase/helicase
MGDSKKGMNIFSLYMELNNCDYKECLIGLCGLANVKYISYDESTESKINDELNNKENKLDDEQVKVILKNLVKIKDELKIERIIKELAKKTDFNLTFLKKLFSKYKNKILKKEGDLKNKILELIIQAEYDKNLVKKYEATELIVQYIISKEIIYTTRDDKINEFWIYKDGIYVPNGATYILEYCRELLSKAYTSQLYKIVIEKVKVETFIQQEELFYIRDPYIIAVENGVLNLNTYELLDFDPKYFLFSKLPLYYNKEKNCPNTKQFIKEIVENENDVDIIQEMIGHCLIRDYRIEKMFMFEGKGRNGKGKLLSLIKTFLGFNNTSNVPLQDLSDDQYAVGELFNKHANIGGDLDNKALATTGKIKGLTGRDVLTVAVKYKNRLSFQNFAQLIFACNELPMVYDESDGFWDRWILINFNKKFVSQEDFKKALVKDDDIQNLRIMNTKKIDSLITEDELSGLLNWAIEGLKRLITNDAYSHSKSTEGTKKQWMIKSNSIYYFCDEFIQYDPEEYITKDKFREKYTLFCRKYKAPMKSDKALKPIVEKFGATSSKVTIMKDVRDYVWKNISFNNKIDELK